MYIFLQLSFFTLLILPRSSQSRSQPLQSRRPSKSEIAVLSRRSLYVLARNGTAAVEGAGAARGLSAYTDSFVDINPSKLMGDLSSKSDPSHFVGGISKAPISPQAVSPSSFEHSNLDALRGIADSTSKDTSLSPPMKPPDTSKFGSRESQKVISSDLDKTDSGSQGAVAGKDAEIHKDTEPKVSEDCLRHRFRGKRGLFYKRACGSVSASKLPDPEPPYRKYHPQGYPHEPLQDLKPHQRVAARLRKTPQGYWRKQAVRIRGHSAGLAKGIGGLTVETARTAGRSVMIGGVYAGYIVGKAGKGVVVMTKKGLVFVYKGAKASVFMAGRGARSVVKGTWKATKWTGRLAVNAGLLTAAATLLVIEQTAKFAWWTIKGAGKLIAKTAIATARGTGTVLAHTGNAMGKAGQKMQKLGHQSVRRV